MYAAGGAFFTAGSLSTDSVREALPQRGRIPATERSDRRGAYRKKLPCRFAARKSLAISGKSEGDVLKGDLSPFKRAQARDKYEFTADQSSV